MGEESIGQFRLEAPLGEGRGGTVYRARDADGETVALRVIAPDASAGPWFADRCLRALQPYAALQHPALLTPRKIGAHEGRVLIAMPLAAGTLVQRLGRPLPIAEALGLLRPVAEALNLLHARRLVHGDIRPANLLFDAEGQLHLAGAGLAPALRDANGFALGDSAARVPGDPVYQAPEQFQYTPFDLRADLYSFGAIAYELLTGRPPFAGATREAIATAHAQPPPAPSTVNPALPGALDAVFANVLATFPFERPDSATALCDAILAAQPSAPAPVDAKPNDPEPPDSPQIRIIPAKIAVPRPAPPTSDTPAAPPPTPKPEAIAAVPQLPAGKPQTPVRRAAPAAPAAPPAATVPAAPRRRPVMPSDPTWLGTYQSGPPEILWNVLVKSRGNGVTGAIAAFAVMLIWTGNAGLLVVFAIFLALAIGAYLVFGQRTIVTCTGDELRVERRNLLAQQTYNIYRWDEVIELRYTDSRAGANRPVVASFAAAVGYGNAFKFPNWVDGFDHLIETCAARCTHLPYTWVPASAVTGRPVLERRIAYSKIPRVG